MKEIQGKSTLVQVSEGSSYRESTVMAFLKTPLFNLYSKICSPARGLLSRNTRYSLSS